MSHILELLKHDAKYRYQGVTDDLFTLHCISGDSSWGYDLPTLTKNKEYSKIKIQKNNDEFKKTLYTTCPFLYNIDLTNLLIAGGSIRSVLLNESINDVDIFLYGIKTAKEGQQRIEKFIIDIYENLAKIKNGTYIKKELAEHKIKHKNNHISIYDDDDYGEDKKVTSKRHPSEDYYSKYDTENNTDYKFNKLYSDRYQPTIGTKISVFSNGNTITLFVNDIKVQIILRLYNTMSEILHGFDIGSSAVGFDGSNVQFTSLSKFSFENMVNVLDTTRRSTTYENRLIKYFQSGFSIVLPNLDISKLKTMYHKYGLSEVCELPYMVFSYTNVYGNNICVDTFHTQQGNDVITDYDFYGNLNTDGNERGDAKYMLLRYNLTELIKGTNRFVIKIDLNDDISILKSKKKQLKTWKLDFNRQIIDLAFIEWNYNHLMELLCFDNISIEKIKKYINVVDVKDFVLQIYLSNLSKTDKESKIGDLINKQKNKVKHDLSNLENKFVLNWITENPTTQLTSSINPIIEDKSLWYGIYYLNDNNIAAKIKQSKSTQNKSTQIVPVKHIKSKKNEHSKKNNRHRGSNKKVISDIKNVEDTEDETDD